MQFSYYPPSPILQETIAYYWTLESEKEEAGQRYRFVPDGFVEWIFHLKSPWHYRFAKATTTTNHKSHLMGQFKTYLDLTLPEDGFLMFGIKFFPWAAHAIWEIGLHEATEQYIDVADLPNPSIQRLIDQLHLAHSISGTIHQANLFFEQYLLPNKNSDLKPIIQHIWANSNSFSSTTYSLSRRRLEQRFKEEIGISPKCFQRTTRINKVIYTLLKYPEQKLTDIGYAFNFADQAHFIHEFKSFTGFSPSQFKKRIQPDGDIFNLQID